MMGWTDRTLGPYDVTGLLLEDLFLSKRPLWLGFFVKLRVPNILTVGHKYGFVLYAYLSGIQSHSGD